MRSSKQQAWVDMHAIKPEWLVLARQVMGEIRDGRPVMDALRKHPLEDGGYLGKYVLVAAYHEMVRVGELKATPPRHGGSLTCARGDRAGPRVRHHVRRNHSARSSGNRAANRSNCGRLPPWHG